MKQNESIINSTTILIILSVLTLMGVGYIIFNNKSHSAFAEKKEYRFAQNGTKYGTMKGGGKKCNNAPENCPMKRTKGNQEGINNQMHTNCPMNSEATLPTTIVQ